MSNAQPGNVPPVPEPFWHRSRRTLWTWRPACIACGERLFLNRMAWESHYLSEHVSDAETGQ